MSLQANRFYDIVQALLTSNLRALDPDDSYKRSPTDQEKNDRPAELYNSICELTKGFGQFTREQLDSLDSLLLKSLVRVFEDVYSKIDEVKGLHGSGDFAAIQSAHTRLRESYENAARVSALPLARMSVSQIEFSKAKDDVDSIDKMVRDAASILDRMKEMGTEAAVTRHEIYFGRVSKEHSEMASKWLWALGLGAAGTVVIALASVALFPIDANVVQFTPHVAQVFISRIVVISIAYYATIICLKNYRIHRHLTISNEQRRNALQTFELFVKQAGDSETKNAVLLETTRAIFAATPSGYLNNEEPDPSPARLIEVLKLGKG